MRKKLLAGFMALALTISTFSGTVDVQAEDKTEAISSQSYLEDREERLEQWYNDAKVGMMYHFGVQTGDPRDMHHGGIRCQEMFIMTVN